MSSSTQTPGQKGPAGSELNKPEPSTGADGGTRTNSTLYEQAFLQLSGVSKRYGGVSALDGVDFACRPGAVHAVLGENGAGKSTLIKIISGVVRPDGGAIFVDGKQVEFASPVDATKLGIVSVFQELSLIPDLSVEVNICLTSAPRRLGFVDLGAQRRFARVLLERVGCDDVHPAELVRNLPLGRRQMVEIAKALARQPRLLILDEATSALGSDGVSKIYDLIEELRKEGVAILYISHRMREIGRIADDCSVFRNGRKVATFANGDYADNQIVGMMIGRDFRSIFPKKSPVPERSGPILQTSQLSWANRIKNVSLELFRGELLGLGGLDGQGQRELLLALFGVLGGVAGEVRVDGVPVTISSPRVAKSKPPGIAFVPEDRKSEGLILPMTVRENMSLASIGRFGPLARFFVIDFAAEWAEIEQQVARMSIKAPGPDVAVGALSGGNQQKVLIGKWLMTDARILLLNDPTRGIDVATKQEIYALMRRLTDAGISILFYTTDYDELIGCCDRVLIFYDGSIRRELRGAEITERNIVAASLALDPTQDSDSGLVSQ
jgi:ribose transport system ATP-binding protein